MAIILGIDPGSRITGYGLLRSHGYRTDYLDSGCIRLGDAALAARLHQLYTHLSEIITHFRPTQMAIERVFMARNADSALKLGHARGVAMLAGVQHGLDVAEYSPRQIKQSVVGKGAAEKRQVQMMVTQLLKLSKRPQVDAADALGVALCHAHQAKSMDRIQQSAAQVRLGRRGRVQE